MYIFDHAEIIRHPLHQIEYSIIDTCNRNCRSCSHFAPLAKNANMASVEEFITNTELLHNILPDVHTFWLIGGEPTLHPHYTDMLKELRKIYCDIPIGIMSNGFGLFARRNDEAFWRFIRDNGIVWRITTYDFSPTVFQKIFDEHACSDLLSLDVNNTFTKLAVLSETPQEISNAKYARCGWERLNIFVRNGRIWKCPTVEYIDLFNDYFGKQYAIGDGDFLTISPELTRDAVVEFKDKPAAFCKYCDIEKRFMPRFKAERSDRCVSEWTAD